MNNLEFNRQSDLILKLGIKKCYYSLSHRSRFFLDGLSIGYYTNGRVTCIINRSSSRVRIPLNIELYKYDDQGRVLHFQELERSTSAGGTSKYIVVNDKLFELLNEEIYQYNSEGYIVYEEKYWNRQRTISKPKEVQVIKSNNFIRVVYPLGSETVSVLDGRGKVIEEHHYEYKNFLNPKKLKYSMKYEYDMDGNKILWQRFDDDKLTTHYVYEYSNGQLSRSVNKLNDTNWEYEHSRNRYRAFEKYGDRVHKIYELLYYDNGLISDERTEYPDAQNPNMYNSWCKFRYE